MLHIYSPEKVLALIVRHSRAARARPQRGRQKAPVGGMPALRRPPRQCRSRLQLAALVIVAAAATASTGADPSVAVLSNGVIMPRVLLGMGPWCNDPVRCPAPAKPCHDCYNDTSAAADIKLALESGFRGIDTAIGCALPQRACLACAAWQWWLPPAGQPTIHSCSQLATN